MTGGQRNPRGITSAGGEIPCSCDTRRARGVWLSTDIARLRDVMGRTGTGWWSGTLSAGKGLSSSPNGVRRVRIHDLRGFRSARVQGRGCAEPRNPGAVEATDGRARRRRARPGAPSRPGGPGRGGGSSPRAGDRGHRGRRPKPGCTQGSLVLQERVEHPLTALRSGVRDSPGLGGTTTVPSE